MPAARRDVGAALTQPFPAAPGGGGARGKARHGACGAGRDAPEAALCAGTAALPQALRGGSGRTQREVAIRCFLKKSTLCGSAVPAGPLSLFTTWEDLSVS